jgi:hypothetical protein
MNERIKQFAELSKSYKTILVDGQMQSVLLIDPERFAEMIVKECIEIADSAEPYKSGDLIKKHFGV